MKKTLLAVAIPALLASGVASATTLYDANGTKFEFKGNMRVALEYNSKRDVAGEDGTKFRDLGSRFGFKVTHDLGDGLYGLGELEYGNNTQAKEDNFQLKNRIGYVGLGFTDVGEFTFGRVLSPFDDVAKTDYTYDYGGVLNFDVIGNGLGEKNFIGRVANTAKFKSAEFSGFSFGATYTLQSNESKVPEDTSTTPVTPAYVKSDGIRNAYTLAAFYDSGFGLKVNAGYGHAEANANAEPGATRIVRDHSADIWGVAAEYTIDALSVAVDFGRASTRTKYVADATEKPAGYLYGVGVKYNLDKANVYAGGWLVDGNKKSNERDVRKLAVGTDYRFTSNVRTFVEYANVRDKQKNTKAWKENKAMVGMRVYF